MPPAAADPNSFQPIWHAVGARPAHTKDAAIGGTERLDALYDRLSAFGCWFAACVAALWYAVVE